MTFKVNSAALIGYAAKLQDCYTDTEMAKNYVHRYGDFSFHESGIIGALAGQHAGLMNQLDELHDRLLTILWRSQEALTETADSYNDADADSAARVDASYPASPRPVTRRD